MTNPPLKTQQITGQRLFEVRSGLAVLKEKRLPNLDAEMLVASMWLLLRPAFELYDDLVRKIQAEGQDAEQEEDADARKRAQRAVQEKTRELPTMLFAVAIPVTKIQSQHLPKAHKGTNGDENPTGNASVIIALGPDYFEFPPSAPVE